MAEQKEAAKHNEFKERFKRKHEFDEVLDQIKEDHRDAAVHNAATYYETLRRAVDGKQFSDYDKLMIQAVLKDWDKSPEELEADLAKLRRVVELENSPSDDELDAARKAVAEAETALRSFLTGNIGRIEPRRGVGGPWGKLQDAFRARHGELVDAVRRARAPLVRAEKNRAEAVKLAREIGNSEPMEATE